MSHPLIIFLLRSGSVLCSLTRKILGGNGSKKARKIRAFLTVFRRNFGYFTRNVRGARTRTRVSTSAEYTPVTATTRGVNQLGVERIWMQA